jgi:hypothetical protein
MKKAFVVFTLIMGIVLVGGLAAQTVKYEFKPPQNNFYIKWKNSDGKIQFTGYTNGGLWKNDGDEHFFAADGKYYYRDGNKWYLDSMMWDANDVKGKIAEFLKEPDMIGNYYTNFWRQYNAAMGGKLDAKLYQTGKERFLGINCDIFKDNYLNRYWIDPSNGCTLKVVSADGREGYEVLEYNLNFTSWPAGLPPK